MDGRLPNRGDNFRPSGVDGFEQRPGKGSHRNYSHPVVATLVTISGRDGDDATKVFVELCQIVEESIETLEAAGKPLPQPLSLHELGAVLQRSA